MANESILNPKFVLSGKTLVISDIHIGLKKASSIWLTTVVKTFKNFLNTIKNENVSNVICCGDVFHSRVSLDLQALNVGIKLISALSDKCKCYLILGNHDLYYKNTVDVNSSNIFKNNKNIEVISSPTVVSINGDRALLVPWLSDLSKYQKESFDLMFGHLDIESKYLIASYVEDHMSGKDAESDDLTKSLIENDALLNEVVDVKDIETEINNVKNLKKTNSGDLVGSFVELVKPGGSIYAGHIHIRKEFISKKRNFIFVGSPYQQNFGEISSDCGYYLLDERNKQRFIRNAGVPKHVMLKISDILQGGGVNGYDFSIATGNIVKKIYDIDILKSDETKINQRINDAKPFEEALPEYVVAKKVDENVIDNEVLDMIKKSKLDYIKSYIFNMDGSIFESSGLSKDGLFEVMSNYYSKAIGAL